MSCICIVVQLIQHSNIRIQHILSLCNCVLYLAYMFVLGRFIHYCIGPYMFVLVRSFSYWSAHFCTSPNNTGRRARH